MSQDLQAEFESSIAALREAGYTVIEPPEHLSEATELLADMVAALDRPADRTLDHLRKREGEFWDKWLPGIRVLHNRLKDIRASVR